MIVKLPKWVMLNKFPSIYDLESLTDTEQIARVYGKMNELIESFNNYVEEINKTVTEVELKNDEDVKQFINTITQLTHNYINSVDIKIICQDRKIAEIYNKFSNDVLNAVKDILTEMRVSGELDNTIVKAVGDLDKKVDNFITEIHNTLNELSADYESVKSALLEDYNATKTTLENSYNQTAENLNNDYNSAKTEIKSNLETFKSEISEEIEANAEQRKKYSVFLFNNTQEPIPNGAIDVENRVAIPNIDNYKIVLVTCGDVAKFREIVCSVYWDGLRGHFIQGTGTYYDNGNDVYITNVNLRLSYDEGELKINLNNSTEISFDNNCVPKGITHLNVTRIRGII